MAYLVLDTLAGDQSGCIRVLDLSHLRDIVRKFQDLRVGVSPCEHHVEFRRSLSQSGGHIIRRK